VGSRRFATLALALIAFFGASEAGGNPFVAAFIGGLVFGAAAPNDAEASTELTELLGYPRDANPLDYSVAPRGYRVLSHIPRLPDAVVRHVVRDFATLEAVVRASHRELEAVDGVGSVRAREIREGLRRLQEHNLVDRYLQL